MTPSTSFSAPERRYDIDWLRVFATYLLLLFHVGMVFNPAPFFHLRNGTQSFFFLILCGFIGLWHMPLFFLLAGWSAHASIARRGIRGFLRERFFRLLVPLVAGCILLMPPIKYFELSSGLDANYTGLSIAPELQASFREIIPGGLPETLAFQETFLEFLPTFFLDPLRFTWAHLWFVAYLLLFTILYVPLFSRLLRWPDPRPGQAISLWIYAPILPLILVQLTMRERWPGLPNLVQDWANVVYYSVFLVAGFVLARFPALEELVERERTRSLTIAVAATISLLLAVLGVFQSPAAVLTLSAIAAWSFVVTMLGWSRRRLSFTNPTLDYLTESAFPVYLLHQSAIVIPGYFLIALPLGLWSKFALLLAIASATTLGAYHLGVRPFSVPRFLCGMKTRTYAAPRRMAAGFSTACVGLAWGVWIGSAGATTRTPTAIHATPLGRWYAEGGGAQVEIAACGEKLCGQVVWLRSPFDESGCDLRDRHNPDLSLRGRHVIGLQVLSGFATAPAPAASWDGGTVYDPGSGNTYRASMSLLNENRLEVRGYIGIPLLGRSTTWFRVGSEREMCGGAS